MQWSSVDIFYFSRQNSLKQKMYANASRSEKIWLYQTVSAKSKICWIKGLLYICFIKCCLQILIKYKIMNIEKGSDDWNWQENNLRTYFGRIELNFCWFWSVFVSVSVFIGATVIAIPSLFNITGNFKWKQNDWSNLWYLLLRQF